MRDRYIRREDVQALWAFLGQVQRRRFVPLSEDRRNGTYVYFTNDEVIEFLDACAADSEGRTRQVVFSWPDFPPRDRYTSADGDHADLLDRGHLYDQKTTYVGRILAVVFRIRPSLGQSREGLGPIRDVQQVGAHAERPSVKNWEAIIGSNAYFGSLLRDSNINQREFVEALAEPDLLPLAERLGASLFELNSLLADIRNAEGSRDRSDHWHSDLLDYRWIGAPKYGPAQGRDTLSAWRDYAGARKRASKITSLERMSEARRSKRTVDDYFSWRELPRSVGWEVRLDDDFRAKDFDVYLDAFDDLMQQRERVDREAYQRLLTSYIGVGADGDAAGWTEPTDCLRAIMLGYLKSHEVVVGGNCLSCSYCVPEAELDSHSVEERSAVVVRMSPEAELLFEQVESASEVFPARELMDALLAEVSEERTRGQSLDRYFEGWSARLLEDEPEHRAALLVRLLAMFVGVIPCQSTEVGSLSVRVARLATSGDSALVWGVVSGLHEVAPGEVDVYLAQAAVRRAAADAAGELDSFRRFIEARRAGVITPSEAQLAGAWGRIRELCAQAGPSPDPELFEEATIALARTARDVRSAQELYAEAFATSTLRWGDWCSIAGEMGTLNESPTRSSPAPILGLLATWVASGGANRPARTGEVVRWLAEDGAPVMQSSARADAVAFAASLDLAEVRSRPDVASWLGSALIDAEDAAATASVAVDLLVVALSCGANVEEQAATALAALVSSSDAGADALSAALWKSDWTENQQRGCLFGLLAGLRPGGWSDLARWLAVAEAGAPSPIIGGVVIELIRLARELCQENPRGVAGCLSQKDARSTFDRLQTLVLVLVGEDSDGEAVHEVWVGLVAGDPSALAEYTEACSLDAWVPKARADDSFGRLVALAAADPVFVLLRSLRRREGIELSPLIARALLLVDALNDRLERTESRLLTNPRAADLTALRLAIHPEGSEEQADVMAATLEHLRAGWNPNWLTPVALEIEALVMARRYAEAGRLVEQHPDMKVGDDREPAAEFIQRREVWGKPREAPPEAVTYSQLVALTVQNWQRRSAPEPTSPPSADGGRRFTKAGRVIGRLKEANDALLRTMRRSRF